MKLYTEEEIKRVFKFFQHSDSAITVYLNELTPIELPSDEEIEIMSNQFKFELNKESSFYGAKWMKEQILKQHK